MCCAFYKSFTYLTFGIDASPSLTHNYIVMSSKTRFAIYFIPDRGALYDAGSRLLGYDIRDGKPVVTYDFIEPAWSEMVAPYGFHLTITDTIDIEDDLLPELRRLTETLVRCFKHENRYEITFQGISFWSSRHLVAAFSPSPELQLLHNVLVASLAPLGSGSEYTLQFSRGELSFPPTSAGPAKIQRFYSPYIFEDFRPHFTCLHSSTEISKEHRSSLQARVIDVLPIPPVMAIHKIALVIRQAHESHYQIDSEFQLN